MPLAHWFPVPRAPTNFSCFQTLSLAEPAVAITDIHPSAEDDYDWSHQPTINLYLSLFLSSFLFVFLLLPPFFPPFGLCFIPCAVLLMCRIWWKSECAGHFDTAPCESNKAITIWPWRTANLYVHLSIFLTRVTFHSAISKAYRSFKQTDSNNSLLKAFDPFWSLTWSGVVSSGDAALVNSPWFSLLYTLLLHSLSRNWT